VTTNHRTPPFDAQRYSVFPASTLPPRELAIKLAGALGGQARDMLDVAAGEPMAQRVDAVEVLRLAGLLVGRGIAVRTEPPFPWAMPRVGSGDRPADAGGDRPTGPAEPGCNRGSEQPPG
jgi:hypothetical protein